MTTYFVVLTYFLVIKTYVSSIPINNKFNITNFRPVNMTELKDILGPQADRILNPIFETVKVGLKCVISLVVTLIH
jgi:hypothetical protein